MCDFGIYQIWIHVDFTEFKLWSDSFCVIERKLQLLQRYVYAPFTKGKQTSNFFFDNVTFTFTIEKNKRPSYSTFAINFIEKEQVRKGLEATEVFFMETLDYQSNKQ